MYIIVFLGCLGAATYFTNKSNEVESNYDFLTWTKKDMAIIGGTFALGCLLQAFDGIVTKLALIGYAVLSLLAMVYVNKCREERIKDYKEQVSKIFEAVAKLTKEKEIDYNNLPFKVSKSSSKIDRIEMEAKEASRFSDANCTSVVYSLDRYFPYYKWTYNIDLQAQTAEFYGQKLPPDVAKWPGSDLRGSRYVPLGVNGDSEVGLDFGEREIGASMFTFDDGTKAGACKLPSAPHALCVGSTGGGKAIWVGQEIW